MKKKPCHLTLTALAAALAAAPALASESGSDNIGPGADGFFVAPLDVDSLPAHLFAFSVYTNRYTADEFGALPGFDAKVTALVPRIDYLSPVKVLGGRLGVYVNLPQIKQEVTIAGFGVQDEESGQGDITVAPAILWGKGKNLSIAAALEITKPTGAYDVARLANTSTNYTTYKPVIPVTWQPSDKLEVSGKFTYSFNQTNPDTDYRSGRIAHVDYSLSYQALSHLHVGVNGYFLKQLSDDTVSGVGIGNRGQASAIGPALHFTFLKYASAELRWEKEFGVENRPKGTNVWAKVSVPWGW